MIGNVSLRKLVYKKKLSNIFVLPVLLRIEIQFSRFYGLVHILFIDAFMTSRLHRSVENFNSSTRPLVQYHQPHYLALARRLFL